MAGALLLSTSPILLAQNGKAERTNAYMSLENYRATLAPGELTNAINSIDIACDDAKSNVEAKTWRYKGQIYTSAVFDPELKIQHPEAALEAFAAYEEAIRLDKAKLDSKGKPMSKMPAKSEYKDGLKANGDALFNTGADAFAAGDYETAYECFASIAKIPSMTEAFVKDEYEFGFKTHDASLLHGLAALRMGNMEDGEGILMGLIDGGGLDDDAIQDTYRQLSQGYYDAGKKDKAKKILTTARKKYPTAQPLLLTEINYALQEGRIAELEGEIDQAIAAAPDNPDNTDLLFVKGNMYDNMYQQDLENGDPEAAEKNMTKAIDGYNAVLAKDAKNFNSQYSIAVVYVNFSNYYAALNMELTKQNEEYSKKYDDYLEMAIENLLKAEQIADNNNDIALVSGALKKIYGKKEMFDKFEEYKAKEEAALNGE